MRISDWSSDVCSSDLVNAGDDHPLPFDIGKQTPHPPRRARAVNFSQRIVGRARPSFQRRMGDEQEGRKHVLRQFPGNLENRWKPCIIPVEKTGLGHRKAATEFRRSEEHTSELQSLMRISYAVFCLKKQKKHNTKQYTQKH